MRTPLFLCAAACIAAGSVAQTRLTLLGPLATDAASLDATGKSISAISQYDIAGVTPAVSGATMFSLLPIGGISAMIGDPDRDGDIAEFYKVKTETSWTHCGCFIKNSDKAKRDPRLVYWTIHGPNGPSMPAYRVFTNGGNNTHLVNEGDFVRIGENGHAEFFIKQEHFKKAAGTQTGTVRHGATDIAQSAGGDIYYSPPRTGHYVSNGSKQVLAREGAIVWIAASAFTYDARGNVIDVRAGSARLVVERGTNGPSINPNIVAMITNSGAKDRDGRAVATTGGNWPTVLTGLALDPAGGTFASRLTGTQQHPHLMFVFDNYAYRATVFSTRPHNNVLGSIAVVNGVTMGQRLGKATGVWIGALGQGNSPTVNGLEVVDWGLNPKAPWGVFTLDTARNGGVDQINDATFPLDYQGPDRFVPIILILAFESTHRVTLSANLSAIMGWFRWAYVFNSAPFTLYGGLTNVSGRLHMTLPTIKDPVFKGLGIYWQAVNFGRSGTNSLSNPLMTEFR